MQLIPPPYPDEIDDLLDAAYQAHLEDHLSQHTQCAALNPTVSVVSCWQWRTFATENATRMVAFRRAIANGIYCECCRTRREPHTPEGTRY